jgi:hypothetical protein
LVTHARSYLICMRTHVTIIWIKLNLYNILFAIKPSQPLIILMCHEAAFSNLRHQKVEASDTQKKKQEVEGIDGVTPRVHALQIADLGRTSRSQVPQGLDPPDGSQKPAKIKKGDKIHLWNIAL